ncbi:type I restriction-modification system subunit M N-terminal domain-containing protein [Turicibacter sanguinis]|uniref:type I restriction-modification system subunit M N-terminal domain-containing protein n=1 Tax=Turicibacter sanguinis TaxID=154288 RepID=UPI00232E8666|nr:type I restriction-modification system subunit M N-terminal domain-containing protein [Turicibacter sanguinis]MDB8552090.1 type I restriction-modification system subunit M N-terminal domain-containing protein [Turicibacter sanguinis]
MEPQELESHLWESANILRGSIDSSDYKNYIFGLLFLKRVNDVFQEVYAHLVEDEGWDLEDAEEERDEYQFFLQEQLKQTLLKQ